MNNLRKHAFKKNLTTKAQAEEVKNLTVQLLNLFILEMVSGCDYKRLRIKAWRNNPKP